MIPVRQRTVLVAFLGYVVINSVVSAQEPVKTLWSENGHLYKAKQVPSGITWDDANSIASNLPGDWHLATVTSDAENAFLYDLVDDDPNFWNCCVGAHSSGPWLGAFSSCYTCCDWQWVTGEPFDYTNWAPREPFKNGDAISFFGYQTFMSPGWNDIGRRVPGTVPSYIIETASPPPVFVDILPGRLSAIPGGTVTLDFVAKNLTNDNQAVQIWLVAFLPNGNPLIRNPLIGPRTITLGPAREIRRQATFPVPAQTPPGDYVLEVLIGAFPDNAVDSSSLVISVQ